MKKQIATLAFALLAGMLLAFVLNGNYRANAGEWCWHMNGISVCSNPGIRGGW